MLKLAAMGVINVPQKPASIPTAPITAGLPPPDWIRIGTPIAAAITGGADVDVRDATGRTPLMVATEARQTEAFRALLAADLVVADCNLEVNMLKWLVNFCAEHERRLLIEPVSVPKIKKLTNFPVRAFAITPNIDQLFALTGKTSIESATAAVHAMGVDNVVVHRGPDGAVISGEGHPPQFIPALKGTRVTDVTGAGDAAVAGLVCGLIDGLDLANAARLGQAAAASKLGSDASAAASLSRARLYELAGLE